MDLANATVRSNISSSACFALFTPSASGPTTALWFKEVVLPVILLFGIPGNGLSFVMFAKMSLKHPRNRSYGHYLCALAIFDSFTLVDREIYVLEEMMQALGRPSLFVGFSDVGCIAYRFTQHVCMSMSSWLVVLMAVERFVVIYFPFRRHAICTPVTSLVAIFCLFVIMSLIQIFTLIMMGYAEEIGQCSARYEYNLLYIQLYTYFFLLCVILVFPMAIILTCNVAVLMKISMYKRVRRSISAEDEDKSSYISRQKLKTTSVLLTISSVYIVTLLPSVLSTFIIQTAVVGSLETGGPDEEACQQLVSFKPYGHVFEVVSALNYAMNFYIYVLSGKAFRGELRRMLRRESSSIATRINLM